MYDELTQKDVEELRSELVYRVSTLRPELLEEVKRTRAFGDLSENYEYKVAKQEQNKNESRIRYLERMINTAVIIDPASETDKVGLGDTVTIYIEEDDVEETYQLVTTVRQNSLEGIINKDSPLGKALMGRKVKERVRVFVSPDYSYFVEIRKIEKTSFENIPIRPY